MLAKDAFQVQNWPCMKLCFRIDAAHLQLANSDGSGTVCFGKTCSETSAATTAQTSIAASRLVVMERQHKVARLTLYTELPPALLCSQSVAHLR